MTDRREVLARATYQTLFVIPALGNDRWNDPTLYEGVREKCYRVADAIDATLAAIDAATPGPATVSEADVEYLAFWLYETYGYDAETDDCSPYKMWAVEMVPEIKAEWRSDARRYFAARTTARGEPYKPSEARITDIRLFLQERGISIDSDDIRAVLFAARNAGQRGAI